MLYSLQAVRDNVRNRDGRRVFYLGKGDQLTSEARDFLAAERIQLLPASQAKPERYRLFSGGWVEEKPESMTHLHGNVLVPKTHPRIAFRGAMDTLEAELLLAQQVLQGEKRQQVGEVLQLSRQILKWEVLEEPAAAPGLLGLSWEELHRRSHFPQDCYGQPHFMPQVTDGPEILQLNRARCAARAAELAAAGAFADREGGREDLLLLLNRLSSALYVLMIELKAEKQR